MVFRLMQPAKALYPMLVTLEANVMAVRPVQLINALISMEVTPSGTTYSVISFPSVSINFTGFPILKPIQSKALLLQNVEKSVTGTIMVLRLLQPSKGFRPMEVTPLPMVAEVRLLQPEKALSPMDVTLLGMVTEVRPLQP